MAPMDAAELSVVTPDVEYHSQRLGIDTEHPCFNGQ